MNSRISNVRRARAALAVLVLAGASLVAVGAFLSPAEALVINVTTTADDGSPGSLRGAIEGATDAAGDEVVLQAGATYVLTCAEGGDIDHGNTPLTITGNGATITMEPTCEENILENGTGALVINNVIFSGLDLELNGLLGAIVDTGTTLTLNGVVASGNSVTDTTNSSLFNVDDGDIIVTNSTITNTTLGGAGVCGIFCGGGTNITITSSTISNTTATAPNVCAPVFCSDDVTLTDTTISNTTGTSTGGICSGMFCAGDVTMTRSHILDTTETASSGGCGMFCSGDVVLIDSSVRRTTSTATSWCGMFCSGDVTLTRSAIDTVTSSGNGYCSVLFCSGDLTFVASSITGVSATVGDGGVCGVLSCAGALVATNSTISQNSATNPDATEIWTIDSATLVYVTMVSNTGGGAPLFESTEVTSFGSVIAQKGAGPICDTVLLVSNGYNFADDTSCGFASTGDRQGLGLDPQLGAVGANGGGTLTMLPAVTSPLVDAIPLASCQADGAAGITTDQRGEPRPAMLGCDIGAVELQPAVVPVVLVPAFTG